MITNKLLPSLIVVGLTTGCATDTLVSPTPKPTTFPTQTNLPTQTKDSETPSVSNTPGTPADMATPYTSPPAEPGQPPVDIDDSPLTSVRMARTDLSRRLRINIVWVEVVEAVVRDTDAEVLSCLGSDGASEELWGNLDEVQWITLSVKGNVHHYVALVDVVIYCDE